MFHVGEPLGCFFFVWIWIWGDLRFSPSNLVCVLGLCFAALVVGSMGESATTILDTTMFPIRDFCVNCDIMEKVLERGEFDVLGKMKGKRSFFARWTA